MKKKIALIGSGVMGQNHARTLARSSEMLLSHVVDVDPERARLVAINFGHKETRTGTSIEAIINDSIDGVIIASPSSFHEEQAAFFLSHGVHVLIEKPAAPSAAAIERLHQLALSNNAIAMVGHVELFNPTVNSLLALVAREPIREVFFRRLSKVMDESRLYHDVVSDLMIHDIAIALRILGKEGQEGIVKQAVGRSDTAAVPDPAQATVRFGTVDAHFRASRAYPAGKTREIVIETERTVFIADLLTKNISVIATNEPHFTTEGVFTDTVSETRYIPQGAEQPLMLEHRFFLDCIEGSATPANKHVSLRDASKVMTIVEAITHMI